MNIKKLAREEIDKTKWNSCVHYANNGNIFGYLWYLDNVAKEWEGLVEGDYESVMPLIGRSKYLGVKELYQPILVRESGIYSIHTLSQKRMKMFYDAIPKEYKLIDVHLNEHHQILETDFSEATLTSLKNHQLFLNKPYEEIAKSYTDSLNQRLAVANDRDFVLSNSLKPEKVVDFYKKHSKDRRDLDRRYHAYLRIMYNILHRGWGGSSGVLDQEGNILAISFFMYSHSKATSLLFASSPEGERLGADVFLYDMMIRTKADTQFILDFNMADDFPLKFGAETTFYQQFQVDHRKWGLF